MRAVLWTQELHMECYKATLESIYDDQSLFEVRSYKGNGRILYEDVGE